MGHISQGVVIVKDLTHFINMIFVTAFLVKNGAENYLQAILTEPSRLKGRAAKISHT
jgi:hypothetical protein